MAVDDSSNKKLRWYVGKHAGNGIADNKGKGQAASGGPWVDFFGGATRWPKNNRGSVPEATITRP